LLKTLVGAHYLKESTLEWKKGTFTRDRVLRRLRKPMPSLRVLSRRDERKMNPFAEFAILVITSKRI
jgi:hypothetical protein